LSVYEVNLQRAQKSYTVHSKIAKCLLNIIEDVLTIFLIFYS